jgi:hypothetical protein
VTLYITRPEPAGLRFQIEPKPNDQNRIDTIRLPGRTSGGGRRRQKTPTESQTERPNAKVLDGPPSLGEKVVVVQCAPHFFGQLLWRVFR